MTSAIFEEWVKEWDSELHRSDRKIVLFLDNCSAHPHVTTTNIQLQFLPPNNTFIIQPMDQGIIKNLETLYRKLVLQKIIPEFDSNPTSDFSAIHLSRKLNLLSALQMLAACWNSVKRDTFQNCYHKAGFIHPSSAEFVSPGSSEPDSVFNETDVGMTENKFIAFCLST